MSLLYERDKTGILLELIQMLGEFEFRLHYNHDVETGRGTLWVDQQILAMGKQESFDHLVLVVGHEVGHLKVGMLDQLSIMQNESRAWDWAIRYFQSKGLRFSDKSVDFAVSCLKSYETFYRDHHPEFNRQDEPAPSRIIDAIKNLDGDKWLANITWIAPGQVLHKACG